MPSLADDLKSWAAKAETFGADLIQKAEAAFGALPPEVKSDIQNTAASLATDAANAAEAAAAKEATTVADKVVPAAFDPAVAAVIAKGLAMLEAETQLEIEHIATAKAAVGAA
jgi:hypothetical protein